MSHEKNANIKIKIKWITVSGCKAEALCSMLTTLLKAHWLAASSHPTTPPAHWGSPSPQCHRDWILDRKAALSHPPGAFSTRQVCAVTSLPKPSPITMEKEITIRSCSFSKLSSQKRISAQFHLGSTNSQVCDDVGPNPSPFVSNRFVFSSSFP